MEPQHALRFAEGSDDTLEGWLVPYGGNFSGRDSYGTYASANTDFCLDWFPNGRPLLYNHGLDDDVRTDPIGRITVVEKRDKGLWMKAQLDKHNEWYGEVRQLVGEDALGLSSGAMAHLVDIDARSGEWKRWPLVEGSCTPTESNLMARITNHSFASAIRSAGYEDIAEKLGENDVLTDAGTRADMTADERDALSDDDFAYIDSKGGRHLPIHDAAHVRAAISRFSQTDFESDAAKTKARAKIVAKAKTLDIDVADDSMRAAPKMVACPNPDCGGKVPEGAATCPTCGDALTWKGGKPSVRAALRASVAADAIPYERSFEDIRDDITDLLNPMSPWGMGTYSYVVATFPEFVVVCRCEQDDDDSYWRIEYTLNEQDEPVLGQSTQVEQVYIPVSQRSAITPLTIDATRLSRAAAAVTERTKDLCDRRLREGRVFSTANKKSINDAIDKVASAVDALKSLIADTDQATAEQARAADPLLARWRAEQLEYLALISR